MKTPNGPIHVHEPTSYDPLFTIVFETEDGDAEVLRLSPAEYRQIKHEL